MRPIDAMEYRKLLEIEKSLHANSRDIVMGLEIAIADLGNMPTLDVVQAPNYRVPSKEEWMERYCTKKQLAGYEARKERPNV